MAAITVRTGTNRTFDVYLSDYTAGTDTAGAVAPKAADRMVHGKSIQYPEMSSDDIETTDWDSLAKEFESGMADYGEAQLTQNFNDQELESALDLVQAGTAKAITIVIKNKAGTVVSKRQGFCVVKGVTVNNTEVGGVLEVQSTYKMSGILAKLTAELPA